MHICSGSLLLMNGTFCSLDAALSLKQGKRLQEYERKVAMLLCYNKWLSQGTYVPLSGSHSFMRYPDDEKKVGSEAQYGGNNNSSIRCLQSEISTEC